MKVYTYEILDLNLDQPNQIIFRTTSTDKKKLIIKKSVKEYDD